MIIAVLPLGYYKGYPRLCSGRGAYVLIKGKRCTIVCRIFMNMMMIDVINIKEYQANDIVILIGKDGDEKVGADKISDWAETIHYELLTRLNAAIPKRVIDAS